MNKRTYSELFQSGGYIQGSPDKLPRLDDRSIKGVSQPSLLLRANYVYNHGYHLQFPHMASLLQYKNMKFDTRYKKWKAQCSICDAQLYAYFLGSLNKKIKNHCDKRHYAYSIWLCLCGEYFYEFRSDSFIKHPRALSFHEEAQPCSSDQGPYVTLYNGHFVFTYNGYTHYVCSACGRVCSTADALDIHVQKCQQSHNVDAQACNMPYIQHNLTQPRVLHMYDNSCQIELPYNHFPSDEINAITPSTRDNGKKCWKAQCQRCNYYSKSDDKSNAKYGLTKHYNQYHTHKSIYLCLYCGENTALPHSIRTHIKRSHASVDTENGSKKPSLQKYHRFYKLMLSSEHKDTNQLAVPVEEHNGGILGKCPSCMFFAANDKGNASDIRQAIRDHYNKEHDTTHVYICACGKCFHEKRVLDRHLYGVRNYGVSMGKHGKSQHHGYITGYQLLPASISQQAYASLHHTRYDTTDNDNKLSRTTEHEISQILDFSV